MNGTPRCFPTLITLEGSQGGGPRSASDLQRPTADMAKADLNAFDPAIRSFETDARNQFAKMSGESFAA